MRIRLKLLFLMVIMAAVSITVIRAQDGTVASSDTLTGSITNAQPFVEIPLDVAENGQDVLLDLQATSGDLDTLMYLLDATGLIVAQNDDRGRGDFNSLIDFPAAPAGHYRVIATRYGVVAGTTEGDYTLAIQITTPPPAPVYDTSAAALAAANFPTPAPHEVADWTILAYYGGDTSLEAGILNDVDEFEVAGGSNARVRIVLLLDRTPAFTEADGNWSTARVYEIGPDVTGDHTVAFPPTIDTPPLSDLGEVDTADGQTLADFLVWGVQNYPAQHYAVTFASHGAGWQGLITDDTTGQDILQAPELQQAFQRATAAAGVDKFDLLINDACLMSSVEYYTAIAPYFRYSIASPELVVTPALDMTLFTDLLNNEPNIDLGQLGKTLVDTYIDRDIYIRGGSDTVFFTSAVTDLNQFTDVTDATERFATLVNSNPDVYATLIGLARANTYTYSRFIGQDSMIDLGHFMEQIIALSDDPDLVLAAQQVITSLQEARLYGNAGQSAGRRTSYYNIYFPEVSDTLDPSYFDRTTLPGWAQMLRNYFNNVTPQVWSGENLLLEYHPPVAPKVHVTQVYPAVSSLEFPPTVSMEVIGRRIANGSFTVDQVQPNGSTTRLLQTDILTEVPTGNTIDFINQWKSGNDQSFFSWVPMTLPVISDGVTRSNELLIRTSDSATLEGRYQDPTSGDWSDVAVLFGSDGSVQSIINSSEHSEALANIEIPVGASFQTYRAQVAPDGAVNYVPGTTFTWPEGGLRGSEEPAPSGDYNLGFIVSTYGGLTGFDSTRVTVDDSSINPTLQGYNNAALGLNFVHPINWTAVADTGDALYTTNPDGNLAINVYYFRTTADTLDGVISQAADTYALIPAANTTARTVDGQQGLQFSHNYSLADDSVWFGDAVALLRQTALGNTGIVLSVESTDATSPERTALFQQVIDNVSLFDAVALRNDESSQWNYRFVSPEIALPVLKDWTSTQAPADVWRQFAPAAEPQGRTFAALAALPGSDANAVLQQTLSTIMSAGSNFEQLETTTYNAEYHVWQAVSYQMDLPARGTITGRLYVTILNGQAYALRFETPAGSDAPTIIHDVFEVMVDGFAPPLNPTYASGGVRSAYVKAATVAANNICGLAADGTICYGNGLVQAASQPGATDFNFQHVQDVASLGSLDTVRVGLESDSSIDPFSVAVIKINSGIPDEPVTVMAFGGATLINRATLAPGQVSSLTVANISDSLVTIYDQPSPASTSLGLLINGQEVTAVARSADNGWLRVLLPDNPAATGWVPLDLFAESTAAARGKVAPITASRDTVGTQNAALQQQGIETLAVEDPGQPHFNPMQAFEVLMADTAGITFTSSTQPLNGILIQTPAGEHSITLQINGILFEIAPGSMIFWEGNFGQVEQVNDGSAPANTSLISQRRPNAWASTALQGAFRVRVNNDVLTSTAGTQVQFADDSLQLTMASPGSNTLIMGSAIITSFTSVSQPVTLSQQDVQNLNASQTLLNQVNLNQAGQTADYFVEPPQLFQNGFNTEYFDQGDVIAFLLAETDLTLEEITALAANDAALAALLAKQGLSDEFLAEVCPSGLGEAECFPPIPPAPRPPVRPPTQSQQNFVPAEIPPTIAGTMNLFEYGGEVTRTDTPAYTEMQRASMTWMKLNVIFTPGLDPQSFNDDIETAHNRGFKLLLSVRGNLQDFAAGDTVYMQQFAAFVGQLAALNPDGIEIWPGANLATNWPQSADSAQLYASLLNLTVNAINGANSSVLIISGAPVPTNLAEQFPGQVTNDDTFLTDVVTAGGLTGIECVGMQYTDGAVSPSQQTGDPRDDSYIRYYFGIVDTYWTIIRGQAPLCITEFGYLSADGFTPLPDAYSWAQGTSVSDQALWIGEGVVLSLQSDQIRLVIVWNVDTTNYEPNFDAGFAVIRPDTTCPACDVLQQIFGG